MEVNLPDGAHFRFESLPTYVQVSGQQVKEMDFAWLHNGKLWLLEVKDFKQVTDSLTKDDFVATKGQPAPRRFEELVTKITDSLLMLLAAWAQTGWGKKLAAELPAPARKAVPLKLIVAIELPVALAVHLGALKTALNDRLRGRVAMVDVPVVTLLDYTRLAAHPATGPYVRRLP
nr:hypothetical protein [Calidifontimicrobium sp. SYSU G02091]